MLSNCARLCGFNVTTTSTDSVGARLPTMVALVIGCAWVFVGVQTDSACTAAPCLSATTTTARIDAYLNDFMSVSLRLMMRIAAVR